MTGLKILAGVLFCLFLLGLVRLGAGVKYSADGLFLRLRFGLFQFQVYPLKNTKKEKPEKSPKGKPQKEKQEKAEKEKGGSLALVKQMLPLVCQAAGELKRKIRVDTLWLDLTVAADDAAAAAMAYGYANMAIGIIWPMIDQNFVVKDPNITTGVDFYDDTAIIYINAALSMRLGQLVSFGLRFGWKFLRIYLRTRPRVNSKKEAIRT